MLKVKIHKSFSTVSVHIEVYSGKAVADNSDVQMTWEFNCSSTGKNGNTFTYQRKNMSKPYFSHPVFFEVK